MIEIEPEKSGPSTGTENADRVDHGKLGAAFAATKSQAARSASVLDLT